MCSDEKVQVDTGVVYDAALFSLGEGSIYLLGTWSQLPGTDTAV